MHALRHTGVVARAGLARYGAFALLGLALLSTGCPEEFVFNAPIRNTLFGMEGEPVSEAQVVEQLRVAEGFALSLFAQVAGVREVRATASGSVLASAPRKGTVTLLARDADGDGRADSQRVLLEGLDRPNGIDLHGGWLYVAEASAIGRIRFDEARGVTSGAFERVVTGLPEGGNHWRRTVRFGPDGWMYATIGSSCNVCFEEDERRATMLRFRPDGSDGRIFARGLRNAADFAWHPQSGALYATDNGRDLLGDDYPPCELNHVVEGGDYGWPVANGARDLDPDLGAGFEARAAASLPPAFSFRAHNAPLGIDFLKHAAQPEAYRFAAVVALHGSWNRSQKDGYKVVSLHWDADGRIHERDFVWGFLQGEDVMGRPVDVSEGPDGAIYLSDDYGSAVYRVVAQRP